MKQNNKSILLSLAVISILSGCVTNDSISVIQPLTKNQQVEQVFTKGTLVTSLTNAKYFENLGSENSERSFHSQIEFLETVLSYGSLKDPKNILLLTNLNKA